MFRATKVVRSFSPPSTFLRPLQDSLTHLCEHEEHGCHGGGRAPVVVDGREEAVAAAPAAAILRGDADVARHHPQKIQEGDLPPE